MDREVDYSVLNRTNEDGVVIFPDDVLDVDGKFILPNGKFLPEGVYLLDDDSLIIYEPYSLVDDIY